MSRIDSEKASASYKCRASGDARAMCPFVLGRHAGAMRCGCFYPMCTELCGVLLGDDPEDPCSYQCVLARGHSNVHRCERHLGTPMPAISTSSSASSAAAPADTTSAGKPE